MESTSKFTNWRKQIPQCQQMLLLDVKHIRNDVILLRMRQWTEIWLAGRSTRALVNESSRS